MIPLKSDKKYNEEPSKKNSHISKKILTPVLVQETIYLNWQLKRCYLCYVKQVQTDRNIANIN